MVASTRQSRRRSRAFAVLAAVTAFGLMAGACGSSKKDQTSVGADNTEAAADTTAAATPGSTGGSETPSTEGAGATTTAAPTTTAEDIQPVMGGKLIVAGEAEAANGWLPSVVQCDSYCQERARTFFDPLVAVDDDLKLHPFLAESVTANEDNTAFTIKLRSGIKFHDGTDLTADVAMQNFNDMVKSLLVGAALVDVAKDADGNAQMEKIDDLTYVIHTAVSWPLFPYYLGGQAGFVASKQWLDAVAAGTGDPTKPVGTGPFIMDSYAPGDKMIVKKNPNYWLKDDQGNQLPYLDEIEFRVIPDGQVSSTALRGGDIDVFSTSDSGVVGDFADDPDFVQILQNQYTETNYILLNLGKESSPLNSQEVRCALGQAIDKQDLIDVIYNGYGVPANGPFSPGQEGYLEDNGSLPYDPDAAAQAIADYEAANGPVAINYSTTTAATSLAVAQYLADAWGQIGVDVTIDQIEQSKLINNALFGDPAFDAFGWRNHAGLYVDSQNFWWNSSSALPAGQLALNFGRLKDPVIDDLLAKARSEADPEVRKGYAEDINREFAKECWIIPTTYTNWGVQMSPKVHGIGKSPQADGDGYLRDGAGFSGQIWLTAAFVS